MKLKYQVVALSAICALAASMSQAQTAYSCSTSYVSATFAASGAGLVFSDASGVTQSHYVADTSGSYTSTEDGTGVTESYDRGTGSSTSFGILHVASTANVEELTSQSFTITNSTNGSLTLYLTAYTYGFAQAYGTDSNAMARADGDASIFDSTELVSQTSAAIAQVEVYNGGIYTQVGDYDRINGSSSTTKNYPQSYPANVEGADSETETYAILLSGGESDQFQMQTGSYDYSHALYVPNTPPSSPPPASTPSPAAIMPFALGLVGARRRRKKA